MAVLGEGFAHGAISLLHAAGIGYGCSMAVDLNMKVRILDREPRNPVEDPDDVLGHLLGTWSEAGYETPEEVHWVVRSDIPPSRGLKSSSALCIAAIRALCSISEVDMEVHEMVDIAAKAQIAAGVSITGSKDDSWACATPGWKLVEPTLPAAEGVHAEGAGPNADDFAVLINPRLERNEKPIQDDFSFHQQAFVQALDAIQVGNELVALTCNGRAMAGVLNDAEGRKLANDGFVNGARAAGISGSGPAIVFVVPTVTKQSIDRIINQHNVRNKEIEMIQTTFLNPDSSSED